MRTEDSDERDESETSDSEEETSSDDGDKGENGGDIQDVQLHMISSNTSPGSSIMKPSSAAKSMSSLNAQKDDTLSHDNAPPSRECRSRTSSSMVREHKASSSLFRQLKPPLRILWATGVVVCATGDEEENEWEEGGGLAEAKSLGWQWYELKRYNLFFQINDMRVTESGGHLEYYLEYTDYPGESEGQCYDANRNDLRPSLDWSLVGGWTVPLSQEHEDNNQTDGAVFYNEAPSIESQRLVSQEKRRHRMTEIERTMVAMVVIARMCSYM
ncbi:hypothetical protein PR202_gb24942 [Eleusine coracana subsp. coracana]|uniref:Uncharacterized protein n=1 Tax=Eleusine coracana subsp. coracana TaxID=191504 RepID=A0AAV5FPA9_ELECO|nr:hypothetical protein PR202_gb24942 [Eleusine coracana subsp. coracana]